MRITRVFDIPYDDSNHPLRQLDLSYAADATAPLPVFVDLHGGGWSTGTKAWNRNYCSALAREGFAAVNMSCRLVPEATLLTQVQDVFAALRLLPSLANRYPLDGNAVCVGGDSAGGQTMLLAAAIANSPFLQSAFSVSPPPFPIRAVGLSSAAPFPTRLLGDPLFTESVQGLIACSVGKYADADAWIALAAPPPVCIVTALDDPLHSQSAALHALLQKRHITHDYAAYEPDGEPLGHVFNVRSPHSRLGALANRRMLDYFRKTLSENE